MEWASTFSDHLFVNVFCLGMALVTLIETFRAQHFLIQSNRKQKLLGLKKVPHLGKNAFLLFSFLLIVILVTIGVGVLPNLYLLLCFLMYFLVYGQLEYLGSKTNLYPFVLFFIAVVPLVQNENISFTTDSWTIVFIKTSLSFVYLSSFIQKVKKSGLSWINGNKMKEVLAYHDLLNESKWSQKLNKYPSMLKTIGIIVLLFEALFWVSIFFPEFDLLFGGIAVLFHTSTFLLFRINYLLYYLPILSIYFI